MERIKSSIIGLILIVVFISLLVAFYSGDSEEVVKVGYIGPLSGPVSTLGIENLRGIELAVEDINARGGVNGKIIELVIEDDMFKSEETVSSFIKLNNLNSVDVVLSPSYNGILSLGSRADTSKKIIVNSIDSTDDIAKAGEYVFGAGIYAERHGINFANVLYNQLDKKNTAVVYNNDESFTVLIKDSFILEFEKLGGKVVVEDTFGFSTIDFRTTLKKLEREGVDNVALIGWDESGLFVRQAEELGLDLEIIGLATFTSQGFKNNAGKAIEGVYFLSWDPETSEYKEIVRLHEEKYGTKPNQPLFVALGYDAMMLVGEAMKSEGDLQEELYNVRSLEGFTGELTMSSDGIVRTINAQNTIFQIEDGESVKIGEI